jgi:hypothetical protein
MLVNLLTMVLSLFQVSDDAFPGSTNPPPPRNALAELADNKFDTWTISRIIVFEPKCEKIEVAPMPRLVEQKPGSGSR